jgi:hypothetical protein
VIYVAAMLPQAGKTLFDITPPGVEEAIMQTVEDGRIPVMSDEILDAGFGEHGLTPEDRAWLRARGVGQPVNTYRDPASADLTAVEGLPRTYIACTGDPGEPPSGPDQLRIDTGHWPMITRPVALAEMIDKVARA